MSTESVGSYSGSFLQPRRLFEECPEQNLQIDTAEMIKPFSSPRQQEDHFRNSVSDGGSPGGAVSIPSDRPVIPMTISQNTHGVVVYSPSSQDGNFTRDHNTCQPPKVRTSQNTPVAVSPDGYNRNKCFISGAGGSGPLDRQATMKMNGEDVPKIQCPCGSGTCIVKTSHTKKNPNRRFYNCPANICNFFQWCDGLGSSSQSPLKPGQGCSRSPGKIINLQNAPLEPKNPTCSCKAGPCIVQTMHHGENKGRKYYACPIKKGHGACKHFEWVDSPVKQPETKSNSMISQNNISIIDVTTPEPKQTLSPLESVKDLFGENDMRTVEFWCKEKDPNSAAATESEINKQLSPGKRLHQPNTMGDISPMKRLNLSDAFQVAEDCPNCGKRGQCIECPILTCFKDDDFLENKQGNAMDGGNISTLATISPIGETSVQNMSLRSLRRVGRCFNKGGKLNGDNYEIWAMKIQYVLKEQDVLAILDNIIIEPEKGTTDKHIADSAAYESWKKKNSIARITLLSSMNNDVMREFRQYKIAKEMWLALKQKFGGTSVTKLRQLTIKFDTYKKRHNHSMRQHLREMSNMISELKDAGHVLTDEQQIQAVIRSLPHTWEHMKVNLTHNESIITLNDAVRHLELEEDRIEASKPHETQTAVHLAGSSSNGGQGQKRKSNYGHKGKQEKKHKGQDRGKGKTSQNSYKKPNKVKIKCFNCGKKGHYARECKELRKTQEQQTI